MKNQKTKFVILGLLTIEPMSGYEIKKFISESISHFWAESNGQLYPALRELARQECIELKEKKLNGKQESHLYSITKKGRVALKVWLGEANRGKSISRDEDLLKLFFGKSASIQGSIALLQKREARISDKLNQYKEIQKVIERHSHSPHALYWRLTLKNGICHAQAELAWCQEARAALQSGEEQ
jgi:DNA-binding PadR family transcriptional regulator